MGLSWLIPPRPPPLLSSKKGSIFTLLLPHNFLWVLLDLPQACDQGHLPFNENFQFAFQKFPVANGTSFSGISGREDNLQAIFGFSRNSPRSFHIICPYVESSGFFGWMESAPNACYSLSVLTPAILSNLLNNMSIGNYSMYRCILTKLC